MQAFAEWARRSGVVNPAGIDRILLRRYLSYLTTRRYARSTVARKAAALRAYFAWCRREELVDADPSRGLSAPAGSGRLPEVLSLGELDVLLEPDDVVRVPRESTDMGDAIRFQDDAVLELLYAAGLRVAELCSLDRDRVDLGGRTVSVLGKGNRERRLPVHERCVDALDRWLEQGRQVMV
ncbi:MAG: tyrosine-type recombinase/integrase, partial [Acidimicrobiales bacterium]